MTASEMFHPSLLSATTQNSKDRQIIAQEQHYGDIKFCILEPFPFQQGKR